MSHLIFERALILQVDDNKDGVFDFDEIKKFMIETQRAKDEAEGEKYALWYLSMFRDDCQ